MTQLIIFRPLALDCIRWLLPTLFLTILVNGVVFSQTTVTKEKSVKKETPPRPFGGRNQIQVDLGFQSFSGILPFDEPFIIIGEKGPQDKISIDQIKEIKCWYVEKKSKENLSDVEKKCIMAGTVASKWTNTNLSETFFLNIDELAPNKTYSFIFSVDHQLGDSENLLLYKRTSEFLSREIPKRILDEKWEIDDTEIQQIAMDIVNEVSRELKPTGIYLAPNSIPSNKIPIFKNSIIEVNTALIEVKDHFNTLNCSKIRNLKELKNELDTFSDKYNKSRITADKAENLKLLEEITLRIEDLYKFPRENNTQNSDLVNAYKSKFEALNKSLRKVNLPKDSPYFDLAKNIEIACKDILVEFEQYVISLNKLNDVTNIEGVNVASLFSASISEVIVVSGTTTDREFVTRSNNFLTTDVGVSLIPAFGQMAGYIGSNVYFRPINKKKPLEWRDFPNDLDRRVSVLFGLTYTSLARENYRQNLLGNNFNLIVGGGIRISDFMKLNSGVVLVSKTNPNPLNSSTGVKAAVFFSFSFDIEVRTVFKNLFPSASIPTTIDPN